MLPAIRALRGSDLIEQIRVTVQHLEQFHQGQRRWGGPARKGVGGQSAGREAARW